MAGTKIGFLCFGEGGSNVGEYAAQKGFPVVAVNSAKIDLEKIKIIPKDCRIHLDGWEGAGRNRDVGREAVLSHAETIFEKIKDKFKDCDMVFSVASTAGGTGSGSLAVGIELLSEINSKVGAITILPDKNESPKAHMNSLECFSELSQYEQLNSTFIIDNDKANQVFKGKDKIQIYQLSNNQLIDNLAEICSLTDQHALVSNFDKNDLLEILSERGTTIISKITIPTEELKDEVEIVNAIRKSWETVCSSDIGDGQIVKAGVFGKIPKELTSMIDSRKVFEEIGMPYDIIESYYLNTEHSNHCIFYTILSGLSYPIERLKQIESEVQMIEQELINRVEVSRTQVFSTNNWNSKFKRPEQKQNVKTSLSDRLTRFTK